MSSWIQALKEYSKINGKYVIPKKGTKAYDEVKKIQLCGPKIDLGFSTAGLSQEQILRRAYNRQKKMKRKK